MYTHNTLNMIGDATRGPRWTPLGLAPRMDVTTAMCFIKTLRQIHAAPTFQGPAK